MKTKVILSFLTMLGEAANWFMLVGCAVEGDCLWTAVYGIGAGAGCAVLLMLPFVRD